MALYAIYLLIAAAVALLLLGILNFPKSSAKRLPLPQDENQSKRSALLSCISGGLPFTQIILEKLKLDAAIKRKLEAAHVKLTPEAYVNIKLLLMVGLTILVYFLSGKPEPIVLAVPFILGYLIPDIGLNKRIAQHRNSVVFFLPETVDLLGLCIEAGLDFTTALNWIVTKVTPSNAMIEELALLAEEIKWGKSRTQALRDMSKRLSIPEVNSFVQSLVQADRMGTPVSEAFRIISEDSRSLRFQRGERMAMKAPIKMLLPLVFCILPVIGIVVGGPLLLQFLQGNVLQNFGH